MTKPLRMNDFAVSSEQATILTQYTGLQNSPSICLIIQLRVIAKGTISIGSPSRARKQYISVCWFKQRRECITALRIMGSMRTISRISDVCRMFHMRCVAYDCVCVHEQECVLHALRSTETYI